MVTTIILMIKKLKISQADHILKPFEEEELIRIVIECFKKHGINYKPES